MLRIGSSFVSALSPVAAIVAAVLVLCPLATAETLTGQAIYKDQCARCHGPLGEGTKKTTHPLAGEKSITQLAAVIARTMPDDDPGSCTGDDATRVAAYIEDTFYSPDAQARLHPQRITLSHLTVGQYRNAVAEVIDSFRPVVKLDPRHGLHGEYFNSKNFQNDKRLIDRIDPQVNFDFGKIGPQTDSEAAFNPDQFSLRWEGSVFATETGSYELVIRTEHALRLWVNDSRKPVVDAMVKSGSDTEYRAGVYLLAGRSYSIRLEIYKGRELQDKKPEKKPRVPTQASVALLWKLPKHQQDELIPARCLSPGRSTEVAVIETPFPPDDRSYGWERGTTVSKEWVAAVTDAALDTSAYVGERLPELAGVADGATDRGVKLRAFCKTFAERAFRRPLVEVEKKQLVDAQFADGADVDLAVKRVIIRVMTSPNFLYPTATKTIDGYSVASKLALTLWDSPPDQTLLAAAAAGKLSKREEIAQQAERMLDDPRTHGKMRQFLMAWLRVDQSPEIVKDSKRFPGFDAALASDLRTSLELFLDDIVWSEKSDFRQLLLSDDVFVNERLAKFYGVESSADAGFHKVKLDPGVRAGVLTQPYMLSVFAYPGESSPIHRGVFMIRGILGITLRPPPNAFTPLAAESHPELTTRERIALQTNQDACISCHGVINPLGFALEDFDAVGRHREKENTRSIDVSGYYETRAGPTAKFAGARALAQFMADSDETHDAFAQQMFQQFVKQPVRAYGLDRPKMLRESFAKSGYNMRKLLVEIAVIAAV